MERNLRLYKKQRLCSPTAIEALFARTPDCSGALAYPLRAVWRPDPGRRSDSPLAFVIVVPKRRLRHAVDRVRMRRLIHAPRRPHRCGLRLRRLQARTLRNRGARNAQTPLQTLILTYPAP